MTFSQTVIVDYYVKLTLKRFQMDTKSCMFSVHSVVFSDFATPLQDLSCGPGADPEFLVSDTGQILKNFLAQKCAFWSSMTLIHDLTVQITQFSSH